jgi:hypothetical protein
MGPGSALANARLSGTTVFLLSRYAIPLPQAGRGEARAIAWNKKRARLPGAFRFRNGLRAFSSEVGTGSREENASKQKAGARF